MRIATAYREVYELRLNLEDPMNERLRYITDRDRAIFELLARARWLSTAQIHRRFFGGRSPNATNKRLRKLVESGCLVIRRPDRTAEAYFRLAGAARMFFDDAVTIPRRLPRQLNHHRRINDLRLWFLQQRDEHGLLLDYFAAEWELKTVDHGWTTVPDAVVAAKPAGAAAANVAVEVDCGTENVSVVTAKLRSYATGQLAFPFVLIAAPGWRRMRSIVRDLYADGESIGSVFVLDLDRLHDVSIHDQVFISMDARQDTSPIVTSMARALGCPDRLSCRQETSEAVSSAICDSSDDETRREYPKSSKARARAENDRYSR